MGIADVILFVSTTSRESGPCVQFVQQYQLPVNIVRLDTHEDRMAAANGEYFQITGVPTLLLIHDDSNIQLYAGREKILEWFQNLVQPPASSQVDTPYQELHQRVRPQGRSKRSSKNPAKYKPKKSKGGKRSKTKGIYGGKPKKKKRQPVEFVFENSDESEDSDEGTPIDFMGSEQMPLPSDPRRKGKRPAGPPTTGLMVGTMAPKKKTPNSDVFAIAKQMEKDMHTTRGYRDEDLPSTM